MAVLYPRLIGSLNLHLQLFYKFNIREMKIKKVLFTHTGIEKRPQLNDWFVNMIGDYECNKYGADISEREIVTREEILEDWKPKEHEGVYMILPAYGEILQWRSFLNANGEHTNALRHGFVFPTRELAQKKLDEIKKLLNS